MGKMMPRLTPWSLRDRLLMNPFEAQTAVSGILTGLFVLADIILGSPLVQLRPWTSHVFVVGLAALIVLGGVAILRGMFDRSDNVLRGWQIERTGLILSGVAWLAYGLWAAWDEPRSILGWLSPILLAITMALQYWSTVLDERRVRQSIGGDR